MQKTKNKIVSTRKHRRNKGLSKEVQQNRQLCYRLGDLLPGAWKKILFKHNPEYKKKNYRFFWNIFNNRSSDPKLTKILLKIKNGDLK